MYVGIDVSKEWVDVAVRPGGEEWRERLDEEGIEELVMRLEALRPQLVVMEATGGYEMPVVAALGVAGVPVAVVNAR